MQLWQHGKVGVIVIAVCFHAGTGIHTGIQAVCPNGIDPFVAALAIIACISLVPALVRCSGAADAVQQAVDFMVGRAVALKAEGIHVIVVPAGDDILSFAVSNGTV